jgi:hypothetical protein
MEWNFWGKVPSLSSPEAPALPEHADALKLVVVSDAQLQQQQRQNQSVSKVFSFWDEVPASSSAAALTSTRCQQSFASSHTVVSDAQLQQQQRQNQSVSNVFSFWDEVSASSSAAAPTSTRCQQSFASPHTVVSDAHLQQQQRQNQSVSKVFCFWDEVPTSASTAAPEFPGPPSAEAAVLSSSAAQVNEPPVLKPLFDAQQQQHLYLSDESLWMERDFWAELSGSSSAETAARMSSVEAAETPAPGLDPPSVQRHRGAPVKYVNGSHATRRISDQRNRQRKKLMGEAFVPNPAGRPPEQFDDPHIKKRQNWADKNEGLAISSEILDPQWQARVVAHADTRQGKKQMGHLADALKMSKTANTMIKNCNEILKGGSQAAVTFEPEELKRLYPADVVGKLTIAQCTAKLRQLGVRAPENTLDSMRTTLARIGATGSITGEAGVRTGGKHRAELTGRLTEGITARDAAKLLPDLPTKYINAAKARENDTAFVSTLGENYASNTTREKISQAQANLYVKYFKNITEFKSGAGPHTKSRILTKQRNVVIMDLFAQFPKLLREWAVENKT